MLLQLHANRGEGGGGNFRPLNLKMELRVMEQGYEGVGSVMKLA